MDKNKENKNLVLLIIIALIINFVNYIFYYNTTNPFYEIWSFIAVLAGSLAITIFPLAIAAFVSVFFVLSKKHKHKYRYYLAIFFLILSLFSLYMSYANSKYRHKPEEVASDAKLTKLTEIEIDGFTRYTSKKDSFIVLFPQEPKINKYEITEQKIRQYQSYNKDITIQYNVFIMENNLKILSDKAIDAFLNNYVESKIETLNGTIISEKSLEFQGFKAREYIYSYILFDIKIIHKGVIFIVDGDPIQLSVSCPEIIDESEVNYKEFVNSFQLVPLELELSDQKYTNDKYGLSFYPPAGWKQRDLLSKKYNKIAIFANEAGHSIEIYESVSPCKEVKKEFLQSDIDKEGNMKKTFALPESNTGMTILVRCIEKSGKTFIIKGVAPEKTYFRSESTFKKSLKTFSFE